MNLQNTIVAIVGLSLLPASAGTSPSQAESSPITSAPASDWQVRAAIYGWAQALDGDIGARGFTAPIDIGFDDIIENLDIAAMGLVEINNGCWGFLADFNYAEISEGVPTQAGTLDFEQKQFLGNFVVTYEVYQNDSTRFGVFGGVRVNWLEVNLSLPPRSESEDKSWVDPVIGARFQTDLGPDFFIRAVGDIGGFGVASDLTWQAMLGLGYRATENTNLLVGYRAIGTDYSSGGFVYDVVASGPFLGLECKF